jgi:ABC-type multidrug transport system ATPase subunit
MSLVELVNVVKRYGQHTVLNGVSLKVEKGEIIAIIGRLEMWNTSCNLRNQQCW